jgi:TPR repeat protein
MASEMGYAKAQGRLAAMYAQGDGVAVDEREAARLSEMSQLSRFSTPLGFQPGDNASILSHFAIEHCGTCETDSEKKMASRHIQDLDSLADSGDAVAQYNLGVKYLKGDGAILDPSEGARYFTLSARQGYAPAQRQLAQMHLRGQAVAKSKVLAHAWLNLAAKQDSAEGISARVEMENLEVSMSSAEIKEAQEIARSGSLKGR